MAESEQNDKNGGQIIEHQKLLQPWFLVLKKLKQHVHEFRDENEHQLDINRTVLVNMNILKWQQFPGGIVWANNGLK